MTGRGKEEIGSRNKGGRRSQQEKREVNALRERLFNELSPTTVLQQIAFDIVDHCQWRCREMMRSRTARSLSEQTKEERDGSTSDANPSMTRWYGADRQALRDGIRFLSQCKECFGANSKIPDQYRERLARYFGKDFLAALTQWTPPNRDAALLVHHLVEHSKTFGTPLPDLRKGECQAVLDPTQSQQMVTKLFDERIQHLRDLMQIFDLKVSAQGNSSNGRVDDSFTAAMRDLQQAVGWFRWLKRRGL
jgi:hypothetical protein